MKENFPNLVKEIDVQEVQEAQRVPEKLDPRKRTPRHIIITLPKIKDKEKGKSYLQRNSHKTISGFLKRNITSKKGLERSIQSHEGQEPTSKIILSNKLLFRMVKCFPDKVKLKFIITKPLLYEMLKGLI